MEVTNSLFRIIHHNIAMTHFRSYLRPNSHYPLSKIVKLPLENCANNAIRYFLRRSTVAASVKKSRRAEIAVSMKIA